ncbi:MAG: hypothetical protein CMC08_01785 [Flavobacteriaceae bacterium]|nr:hypothetical protein [Flavobacteriaceae bacterium]
MKKIIFTGLILAFAAQLNLVQAQVWDRQFTAELFRLDEEIKRNELGVDFEDPTMYTGSPYSHPSYLMGKIYKDNELLADDVALRYNVMADELEVKRTLASPMSDARMLTKSPDIYVKIAEDIFVFVPYKGGVEGGGYFEVLYEGTNIDLFKKHMKDFTPAKPATTSITRPVPAKFADEPVYYLVTKAGKFYEMPNSRSKKLKVFGSNKDLIKDYVKDNGLDLNNQADLERTVRYYDNELSKDSE